MSVVNIITPYQFQVIRTPVSFEQPMKALEEFKNIMINGIQPNIINLGLPQQTEKVKRKYVRKFTNQKSDKQCANCGVTETPQWRNGPDNICYCNKCGLKIAKKQKREKVTKNKSAIDFLLN